MSYPLIALMKQLKYISLIEVHFAAFLVGFVGIFVKLTSMHIISIAAGRAFSAAIFLSIFILWTKKNIVLKTKKDYGILGILGIIQALQWLSVFQSFTVSSVAVGLLSLYTFPIFVSLFEPFFFKEQYRLSYFTTSLLIFLGIFLIIPEINLENKGTQGVLWGIISAILSAFLFLITRKYTQKYSSTTLSFYKFWLLSRINVLFILLTCLSTVNYRIIRLKKY
jgi:drug/metabolite transporter (DMT)-like permease